MKVMTSSDNLHTCDNCHKLIKKWDVHVLVDQKYAPGQKFDKCCSDIKIYSHKIVELCPDCMNEVWDIYGKNKEESKNE